MNEGEYYFTNKTKSIVLTVHRTQQQLQPNVDGIRSLTEGF